MAASHNSLLVVLLLTILASAAHIATATRPLEHPKAMAMAGARARLVRAEGEDNNHTLSTCWDSLLELQSCSGEVIVFFLNGETNLGPECCRAIYTIEHHCWPSMLGSLGYNSEESNVLRGYCDASEPESHSLPPPLEPEFEDAKMKVNHAMVNP